MPSLRQTLTLECSVCKQYISSDQEKVEASAMMKLFGAADYFERCCCCGQPVLQSDLTVSELHNYRKRWMKWAHKLIKERKQELLKKIHEARASKVY